MVLCTHICTCSTSRSSEQSTKHRSSSEIIRKVCLFYSQNNKIISLSNMADMRCAKVCGLLFLDCAFWMLIGWAGKLGSRGLETSKHNLCNRLKDSQELLVNRRTYFAVSFSESLPISKSHNHAQNIRARPQSEA